MKLGDVCHIGSGGTPSRRNPNFYIGEIPWAKISDIENSINGILTETEENISVEGLKSIGNRIFPEGTLLFAMYGSIGKVAITGRELATNQAILGIRPKNKKQIHLPYLKVWFERNKQFLISQGRGVALQNLSATIIRNLTVPFPSIKDQIHIANFLSRVENLITQRNVSIRLLDEFLKSTFLEMFGDPVRNEKGFGIRNLSEFYINPKDGTKCGPFGSALKKEEFTDFGIPVWTMYNILKDGQFITDGCLWISEIKYEELKNYNTKNGDIIISRAGTVGKMCIIKTNYTTAIISSNLIRLRLGKRLLPIYFLSLMKYFQSKVIKLKQGNEDAYSHMSTGILDKINFPYPPLELQNEFANIVEETETLKVQYQSSLQELEKLYNSLSQQAFKGELNAKSEELLMAAESRVEYNTK